MVRSAPEVLKQLSEAFGPSGFESDVRTLIADLVAPLSDEVRTDALGNLIAVRRGRRSQTLMLSAHMDEVGFLVGYVEPSGFLRLTALGGWDARILPSHAVTLRSEDGSFVRGVIGSVPPHVLRAEERTRGHTLEELFVDVGASSRADLDAMGIGVGTPVVASYPFEQPGPDLLMGKAFDDRAGCTVLIKVLESLRDSDPDLTVAAAFTVGEETGLRGARTAAFQVRPAVALALEGTTAADVPGVAPARQPAAMGKGATITIQDTGIVVHPLVFGLLREIARRDSIPHQVKLPGFGGTDAGAIHQTAEGSMCGVLSVPCRYIHSPLSMLRPSDLDATIRLARTFVAEAGSLVAAPP